MKRQHAVGLAPRPGRSGAGPGGDAGRVGAGRRLGQGKRRRSGRWRPSAGTGRTPRAGGPARRGSSSARLQASFQCGRRLLRAGACIAGQVERLAGPARLLPGSDEAMGQHLAGPAGRGRVSSSRLLQLGDTPARSAGVRPANSCEQLLQPLRGPRAAAPRRRRTRPGPSAAFGQVLVAGQEDRRGAEAGVDLDGQRRWPRRPGAGRWWSAGSSRPSAGPRRPAPSGSACGRSRVAGRSRGPPGRGGAGARCSARRAARRAGGPK